MTATSPFDWSQLPQSKAGDEIWFNMVLPDEIGKLRRLHGVITEWRSIANTEFEEFEGLREKKQEPSWDTYGYDPVQEGAHILLETERVMFANLGVTIASGAENFVIGICKARGVPCTNESGNSHFGIACQCLGCSLKCVISELPGYLGNQRARILGNCFKHSEGLKSEQFVKKFGGILGERIEYENEDWLKMIADTETLLSEITQRLKPKK